MSFDRFAERVSREVVRAWFFWLVILALLAWLPTLFLWETGASDLLVDALCNPLSLILLLLIQNAQNRQERAQDSRQDTLEHALAVLLRHAAADDREAERREALCKAAEALEKNAQAMRGEEAGGSTRDEKAR